MKLKSLLGATSSWLDVTPSVQVFPRDLEPATEKSWQRDITRASKKLSKENGHVPRETCVVRIPEAAGDGYFRLVLCSSSGSDGKKRKTLVSSPVFRVASTSTDSSCIRGASLTTLPLEMGVKAASFVASNTVARYTGPVVGVVGAVADKVKPGFVAEKIGGRVAKHLIQHNTAAHVPVRGGQFYGFDSAQDAAAANHGGMGGPMGLQLAGMVVGSEEGPSPPFPIKFSGKIGVGTGRSRQELGMPTANLTGVSEDIKTNLLGVYFGWASLLPGQGVDTSIVAENCWYEALVMATCDNKYASVLPEKEIKVYMAHEFADGNANFKDAKMKVILMGFIRPEVKSASGTTASVQDRLEMASQDVMVAMASLGRENWGPDVTVERLRKVKSERSLGERVADARGKVERAVTEKVPLHVAGIRTGDGELRDRIFGAGGYWVAR